MPSPDADDAVLRRNDVATKERLLAALHGHREAQRIRRRERVDPAVLDDDQDDFTADE